MMEGQETPACSRKDLGKRPRIFTVDNVRTRGLAILSILCIYFVQVVETVTFTTTSTIIETGFNTATFTVSV